MTVKLPKSATKPQKDDADYRLGRIGPVNADEVVRYELTRTHQSGPFPYYEPSIIISVKDDGAIWFSEKEAEDFIYLYPKQVIQLKKILRGIK